MVNDLLPFLGFVEHHPVGRTVDAVVESYSSHGAYVTVGDARAYLPLRNISTPAPRSAREAVKLGDTVPLVVVAFHAQRRGIDLATPEMATALLPAGTSVQTGPVAKRTRKKAVAVAVAELPDITSAGVPAPAPTKRAARGSKRAAAAEADEVLTAAQVSAVKAVTGKSSRRGRGASSGALPDAGTESVETARDQDVDVELPLDQPAVAAAKAPTKRSTKRSRGTEASAPVEQPAAHAEPAGPAAAASSETPAPAPSAPSKRSATTARSKGTSRAKTSVLAAADPSSADPSSADPSSADVASQQASSPAKAARQRSRPAAAGAPAPADEASNAALAGPAPATRSEPSDGTSNAAAAEPSPVSSTEPSSKPRRSKRTAGATSSDPAPDVTSNQPAAKRASRSRAKAAPASS
jgi:S1 RNA binding domain